MKLLAAFGLTAVLTVSLPLARVSAKPHLQPASASCTPATPLSSASSSAVVAANTDLGFRLFTNLLDHAPQNNVLLSPLSASLALDLTYTGAQSTTQSAMAKALGLGGLSTKKVEAQSAALLAALSAGGPNTRLAIANAVFARAGFALQKAFVDDAKRYFAAKASTLNFQSPAAVQAINHWVSCVTRNTIPSIISRIPPGVALYVMDALYFHALWGSPFLSRNTQLQSFITGTGTKEQVHMMFEESNLPYYRGSNFQLIGLPYKDSRFAMYVMLPDAGTSLGNFKPSLSPANWQNWLTHLKPAVGDLSLPRFTIRNNISLKSPLSALGMGSAFSNGANFLGICKQPCKLTDAKQKTFLNVYEKGTTASAVTSVGVGPTAVRVPAFRMVVDHPFFLGIMDSQTHAFLFLAGVNDPIR